MEITFDPAKRDATFEDRGLAFEDAAMVFEGRTLDMVDDRFTYGEERIITVGRLAGRLSWYGHNGATLATVFR